MNVQISKWYYRFGNNVIQLINAIKFALRNNYYFSSPDHIFFSNIEINTKKDNNLCVKKLFYYDNESIGLDNTAKIIAQKYLYPKLKNINFPNKILDSTLHIHIRSGDVFIKHPHKAYVQNPLWYFDQIIERYDHVILISQDYKNPVTDYLIKNKKVEPKIGRLLKDDIGELLSSTNLCIGGVGSFIPCISLLSNNLKNIYTSNIQHQMFRYNFTKNFFNIHQIDIDLNKYIKIGQWENTEFQRQLMVNYNAENKETTL